MSAKAKAKILAKVLLVFAMVGGVLFGAMKVRDKLAGDKKPVAKWGAMARVRVATVRLAAATVGTYVRKETYPGELAPPQTVDVAMKLGGRLTHVNGLLGESVERGALIAEIENADVRSQLREAEASTVVQKAALARAEVDLTQWERELERKGPLFKKELLPVQEKETLEARRDQAKAQIELATAQVAQAQARSAVLRIQLDATRAHAPWSGKVARRLLYAGAVVAPGAPILTLVDTDTLVARFRVPEREAGDVKEGLAVDVVIDALGGERLLGRVVRLAPTIDAASRTRLVEAEVTGGMRPITPGMFVRAEVKLEEREGVTMVPRAAIAQAISEKGETVLMRVAVGWKGMRPRVTAREMKVTLGKSMADDVEVGEGIEAGEAVIVDGHANLRHRDPVRVARAGRDDSPRRHGVTEKPGSERRFGAEAEADAGADAETGAEADGGAGTGGRRAIDDDDDADSDAGAEAADEKPKTFRLLRPRADEDDDGETRRVREERRRRWDDGWLPRGPRAKNPFEWVPPTRRPSGTFIKRGVWGGRQSDKSGAEPEYGRKRGDSRATEEKRGRVRDARAVEGEN
ncbi:MAG: efflux RND transporter periplasmic adaptor subunit [Deltaproteobacteria bacterium]|nr:efflux RND transporter periplasmic adaptor subunit [Deltaproteobacteria bacterium]